MPLEFGWEPLDVLLDDGILPMAQRHYDEIALDKGAVELAIDVDAYVEMEQDGRLHIFTARRDGALIGYIMWFFFFPERYRLTQYCSDHLYWLDPNERNGWTGYLLWENALEALPRPCKVQVRTKLSYEDNRVSLLLQRLGLLPIEMVHSAYLEE